MIFEVLGPVRVTRDGVPLDLRGPRHREVLARLIAADGRVVPLNRLIDDLWGTEPPESAAGSVRTFVGALRRALEPDRPPRTPSGLLRWEASGYALSTTTVDAGLFAAELAAAEDAPAAGAGDLLDRALGRWRGVAYADVPDAAWAVAERQRLAELWCRAVEVRAGAWLDLGRAAACVPDLTALTAAHPYRERAWWLLALALHRDGRTAEALAALRRARTALADDGLDPGEGLRALAADVLRQAPGLDGPVHGGGQPWSRAAARWERTVPPGSRTGLRSTVDLLRALAVTGGGNLVAARAQRLDAIRAAERLGEPELTARIIGGYDVPAIWARSDDPAQARAVVAAAERVLPEITADPVRARLLTTIAVESRRLADPRGERAAAEAETIARRLGDPRLLVFALNGVFLQSFRVCGRAPRRDALGAEIVEVAARHELTTYEILGHLIRMQARSGLGDLTAADEHAAAAERLAESHEAPLAGVFTRWFRVMRSGGGEAAYRAAAEGLDRAGMPGLSDGLLPFALLTCDKTVSSYGPYQPWVLSLILNGDRARDALRTAPEPPPDHFRDVRWALIGRAAKRLDRPDLTDKAVRELEPAAAEHLGAGSGLLTFGPVRSYLDELTS